MLSVRWGQEGGGGGGCCPYGPLPLHDRTPDSQSQPFNVGTLGSPCANIPYPPGTGWVSLRGPGQTGPAAAHQGVGGCAFCALNPGAVDCRSALSPLQGGSALCSTMDLSK